MCNFSRFSNSKDFILFTISDTSLYQNLQRAEAKVKKYKENKENILTFISSVQPDASFVHYIGGFQNLVTPENQNTLKFLEGRMQKIIMLTENAKSKFIIATW